MTNNLPYLRTDAGIFQLGSRACFTGPDSYSGLVTAIRPQGQGQGHRIELNGRRSEAAECLRLEAGPEPVAHALLHQHSEGVTSGALEVRLPGENDRIIFCNTAAEVMALLARTIGVRDLSEEVACLERALAYGPLDEKRWRGSFGHVGQLAYVSSGREREQPRFVVGDTISAYSAHSTYRVEGIQLLCDVYNRNGRGPLGEWHYLIGGPARAYPIPESSIVAPPR